MNTVTYNELFEEAIGIPGINSYLVNTDYILEVCLNEAEEKSENGFKKFLGKIIEVLKTIKDAIIGFIKKIAGFFKKKNKANEEQKKEAKKEENNEETKEKENDDYEVSSFLFKNISKVCDHIEKRVILQNEFAINGILVLLERYENSDMDEEIEKLKSKIINYDDVYKEISTSDEYIIPKGVKLNESGKDMLYKDQQMYNVCENLVEGAGNRLSKSIQKTIKTSEDLSKSTEPAVNDTDREKQEYETYKQNAKKGITIVTQLEKSTFTFIERFMKLANESYENINKIFDKYHPGFSGKETGRDDALNSIKDRHEKAAEEIKKSVDNINNSESEGTKDNKEILKDINKTLDSMDDKKEDNEEENVQLVKEFVDKKSKEDLKYLFDDSLDVDPTFVKYKADWEYAKKHFPEWLEDYKELTPFRDKSGWTRKYWALLKVDFLKNPCEKRFDHMREVAKVVHADKLKRLLKERAEKNRQNN